MAFEAWQQFLTETSDQVGGAAFAAALLPPETPIDFLVQLGANTLVDAYRMYAKEPQLGRILDALTLAAVNEDRRAQIWEAAAQAPPTPDVAPRMVALLASLADTPDKWRTVAALVRTSPDNAKILYDRLHQRALAIPSIHEANGITEIFALLGEERDETLSKHIGDTAPALFEAMSKKATTAESLLELCEIFGRWNLEKITAALRQKVAEAIAGIQDVAEAKRVWTAVHNKVLYGAEVEERAFDRLRELVAKKSPAAEG